MNPTVVIGGLDFPGGLVTPLFSAWSARGGSSAQTNSGNLSLNIGINGLNQPVDVDGAMKVLAVMTLLTLAPSIILLMTCFTRIVIVLSFVRSALSLQGAPSNQIMIGLSLFLTFFIMAPVWERIDQEALEPYRAKQITGQEAMERASGPDPDVHAQADAAQGRGAVRGAGPAGADAGGPIAAEGRDSRFHHQRTADGVSDGLPAVLPFILIDLVVATVLMSMGMMMMPPMTISLPLKILLFVLVDGWHLVVSSIIQSFATRDVL